MVPHPTERSSRATAVRRRAVLAGAGAGLAALAGCSGGDGDGGGDGLVDDCSAVVGDGDVTGCFPGTDDGPVTLERSTREWVATTGDSTVETLSVVARNESDAALALESPSWRLLSKSDGGWSEVATADGGPSSVAAGSDHTWTFSVSPPPTQDAARTTYRTLDVDDGVYAFVLRGSLADPERTVRVATAFSLVRREAQGGTVGL